MKVTLKEIARCVGVAESTVSRVLSKEPTLSLSDEKVRAIIETAEELNYVRKPRRRNRGSEIAVGRSVLVLHAQPTDVELSRPFFVGLRKGIEAAATLHGIEMERIEIGMPLPKTAQCCLGVIVIGDIPTEDLEPVLSNRMLDLVMIDPADPISGCDVVLSDIDQATLSVFDGLQKDGFHNIACLDLVFADSARALVGRGEIFRQWLQRQNKFDPDYLAVGQRPEANGRNLMIEMIDKLTSKGKPLPDALVATTDTAAAEAYQAIAALDMSVPKDIVVVGTNDSSIAKLLNPPLSSINIPVGDMGSTALELLLERSKGRDVGKTVILHTCFIERESTRLR